LADCGVQSIWAQLAENWSDVSISLLKAALKQSTISKYDALLINCAAFCERRNENFPPRKVHIIAEWFVDITTRLNRPKPVLKQAMAALSAINIKGDIPVHDPLIRRLKKGIINSRTKKPLKSATLFDIPQLINYIKTNLPSPSKLKDLRDKALLLLAIATMSRPDDLTHLKKEHVEFVGDRVHLSLLAVKNDYNMDAIKKTVSPCSDKTVCPVHTLAKWLEVASSTGLIKNSNSFVFMNIQKKGGPLKTITITKLLKRFIIDSGAPNSCSAKSVRTSAATQAAKEGLSPQQIMSMGGWKDLYVLAQHYIQHTDPPANSTDLLFSIPSSSPSQNTPTLDSPLQRLANSTNHMLDSDAPLEVFFAG
jgi:integrase